MIYSITDKRLFNVIDIIMRGQFGDYTITTNENNINEFFADHGFYSVIDETLYVNSTGLIDFINDIIDLTSEDILKFYFSKVFNRLIDKIYNSYGHEI